MKALMLAATAALAVAAAIEPAGAWMRGGGGFGGSWGHTGGGGFYHEGDAGGFNHATEVGPGGVAHESDAGGAWHGTAANGYGAYHGGDYGGYYHGAYANPYGAYHTGAYGAYYHQPVVVNSYAAAATIAATAAGARRLSAPSAVRYGGRRSLLAPVGAGGRSGCLSAICRPGCVYFNVGRLVPVPVGLARAGVWRERPLLPGRAGAAVRRANSVTQLGDRALATCACSHRVHGTWRRRTNRRAVAVASSPPETDAVGGV